MSFQVQLEKMTATRIFLTVFIAGCSGDWIHLSSTPLHKVVFTNDTVEMGSTRLFSVPADKKFDYSDEYTCSKIHNLTMESYARASADDGDDLSKSFLKKLEVKLQQQIEDRIKSIGREREARTYHIGFPSLEGALISISLLLFAVYLIKLVMKVIYTFNFKRGTTEYVGFLSNLRQPLVIAPNRQKRSFDMDMASMRLKALLEEQYRLFY